MMMMMMMITCYDYSSKNEVGGGFHWLGRERYHLQ